jgi:hypothetical protein
VKGGEWFPPPLTLPLSSNLSTSYFFDFFDFAVKILEFSAWHHALIME